MRINKYLSERGVASRRGADKLIEDGRVRIDGKIAVLGDVVEAHHTVTLDGEAVAADRTSFLLLAYNKPVGVECTTNTSVENNIVDAINYKERIFPIGRLDKNSEGLILLTNDGDIVNKILRCSGKNEKEYWVRVDKALKDWHLEVMRRGVDIGDPTKTHPCKIERQSSRSILITLTEGRNRQIRRMLKESGHRVEKLKRVRIANIRLEGLETGELKELVGEELKSLLKLIDYHRADLPSAGADKE